MILKKLKAFYNKDNFDHKKLNIGPYEYHTMFYFYAKAYQVLDTEPTAKWTYVELLALFIIAVTTIVISCISLYYGFVIMEENMIPHISEALTYVLVVSYEVLMLVCVQIFKRNYAVLHQSLRDDFAYVYTEKGEKYRQRFLMNQLETWKICCVTCVFLAWVALGIDVFSILFIFYSYFTRNPDEYWVRPLVFPYWYWDLDFSKSPTYEIAFMFAFISVLCYGYNYAFMMLTQIIWIRQMITKADLIIWALEDLLESIHPTRDPNLKQKYAVVIKLRLRDIIIHHQALLLSANTYSKTYKILLLFEQKLCAPLVCLTAFGATVKFEQGEIHGVLIILCIGIIVITFVPSYLVTTLSLKLQSISDACWNIKFWNADPVVRVYLVLMMMRSSKPLPLSAPGFEPISCQTFSRKMTSAYTFYNMLRQTNM